MHRRILIAPLNWGLGHAARCIPIINALLKYNFEPFIASDGEALEFLKKEFPKLICIELPSYNVTYPKKGKHFRLKFLIKSPSFLRSIKKEKKAIDNIISTYNICGIISDNRFGVYSKNVPSVYITHQLNVLSGSTRWLSTKWHQSVIKKFNECWVPDFNTENNLSGILSKNSNLNTKFIGPLSRLIKESMPMEYDIMVSLSGPEPQRFFLEEKLLTLFKKYNGKVLFIKGFVAHTQIKEEIENITVYNFMQTSQLNNAINSSKLIIARSGYSTIMDLAKIGKRVFFIPTPGQFEQEYLANYLEEKGIAPYADQDNFTLEHLKCVKNYKGFKSSKSMSINQSLFSLFECK